MVMNPAETVEKKDYSTFEMSLRAILMQLALTDGKINKEKLIDFFTDNFNMVFEKYKWIEPRNFMLEKDIDVSDIPVQLLEVFDKKNVQFIAGGSIINLLNPDIPFNDYDVYFSNPKDAQLCTIDCLNNNAICRGISKSSITFEMPYRMQIIKRYYGNPSTIMGNFDIEACKVGVYKNGEKYKLYYTEKALDDIKNKQISIGDNTSNFIASFYRVQKYINKGFEINPQQVLKLFVKHKDYVSMMDGMYSDLNNPEKAETTLDILNQLKYSSDS